eukprot:TRINITY_DN8433_c1_g2_i1.p1 TRINITY_DN8433_c1_g2~~TRINITY_DN8433_c1_g2_i1.p1  ORF type:complete len:376 (+),score=67.82 TRINITY_DN8433_c1_g2_i1:31-1158(+)
MLRFDQQVRLPVQNEADYVHDIAYDHYGTRLALCTSSLRISVFSLSTDKGADDDSRWVETARMERAHSGPIWRLNWGHPEHGDPLASCSEDRTVAIWYGGHSGAAASGPAAAKGSESLPRWEERERLSYEGPVVDVRFAPAPVGLKLAACTADGKARIYECVNALDLRTWESEELETLTHKPPSSATPSIQANSSACSSACLDWMHVPFGGGGADELNEVIALAGRGGRLAIWTKEKNERWRERASSEAHPVAAGGIKDVAWCPNICRPYEVIATCGAGAALWRVDFSAQDERQRQGGGYGRKETGGSGLNCTLQLLKELIPSNSEVCPVWRCSWNLTGTTLALCPEGSEVSVWKADASQEWKPECEIELGGSDD